VKEANRRRQPGDYNREIAAAGAAAVALGVVVVLAWAAAAVTGADTSGGPLIYLGRVLTGSATFPPAAAVVLAVALLLLAVASIPLVRAGLAWSRSRTYLHERARALSTARDTAVLRAERVRARSMHLSGGAATTGSPLGRHARDGARLWSSLEWVQVWIMGPRAGKTTCVCVPQILAAPGAVVATSNKRDIVDLTRGPRSERGATWVFDPQDIVGEPATWWWNPLTAVTGIAEADQLAALFVAAQRDADSKTDAYFDNEGQALLSGLLLAAALDNRPITQVYTWLTKPDDTEPSTITGNHGYDIVSESLFAATQLTPKQRDGVYGTARAMAGFLRNDQVLSWVTHTGPDDTRPQFDPDRFVRSRQSIYVISREGRGTARALTAALTVAIVDAAEKVAGHTAGGRLPVPLTVVLDEAANVCRWPELPDLYSHFGSKGIVISTFLQSYSQGAQVWGENGMRKLWSASNIRAVGAGLAEERFLTELSHLIGDRDIVQRSTSRGGGRSGRSTSRSLHREPILPAADLAKIPQGWAVMLASGMPATVLRLEHYSATPHAAAIAASQEYYAAQLPSSPANRARPGAAARNGTGPAR
jgi:type IV secretory pathway TraG/TraD family ATPase VirD4